MRKPLVNIAASVRQQLLNLAHEREEDFGLLLTKYGLERVLYRMAQSKHRELFVLKGALLFELWTGERYRPTRDADFLAREQNVPERFAEVFKEICGVEVEEDGLEFDVATVTASRSAQETGIRVKFFAHLENARIPIQIDLGFGDVITPEPVEAQLPTLLEQPAPRLLTYPRESVIAEKFEALVSLGMATSRMKDLYDIRTLSRGFSFDGGSLSEAIASTFKRRETKLSARKPLIFTAEFFAAADKKKQWAAFSNRNSSYIAETPLQEVCQEIDAFLSPVLQALAANSKIARRWTPEQGWR